MPFARTLTFFRSVREFFRLVTLEQTAGLLLLLLSLLPQPARNAAATAPAAASALQRLAIIPAACKIPAPAASPARGEGPRRMITGFSRAMRTQNFPRNTEFP